MDADVHAALKRQFQEGTLRATSSPPRLRRLWPLVAAAAVIVLLLWGRDGREPQAWTVRGGEGRVNLGGNEYALIAPSGLDSALRGGGRLQVGKDSALALGLAQDLVIELLNEAQIELPSREDLEFGGPIELRVQWGELRVITGPTFVDRSLIVTTPDARVETLGTVFSVVCDSAVTCVCVLEGRIAVGADKTTMDQVPAGQRKVLFRDRRPPLLTESAPEHSSGLEGFRKKYGPTLDPR
jgi:ferric-dicitrate binding protein FerR (iron transport regulator)